MKRPGSEGGIPRRAFVKAAVAIGGSAALAACLDRGNDPDVPTGPAELDGHPTRQHAWNDALRTDDHGNPRSPRHHVLLALEYAGDGQPRSDDRDAVERAFRGLERAYKRSSRGLLFTVGYSPSYFERYEAGPSGVDLPRPEALAPFEDPDPDRYDAVIHLASDHGSVVLEAEEALFGRSGTANDVDVDASVDGVFETVDRRTGFVGGGLPADNQDVSGLPDSEPVDDEAPLFMGFKSNFRKNQSTEDRVTIDSGPFAGGTTQHVSKIALHLEQWYEQDGRFERVAKMFCPAHAESGAVEGAGDNLGDSSEMSDCPAAADSARNDGVVGHSQKMVSAREDDRPLMIRRDFDSTDDDRAGLHFVALQRTIDEFVETRRAMNGTDLAEESAVGQRNNNGILQYMTVERRGNFLVPPRPLRALPSARPDR